MTQVKTETQTFEIERTFDATPEQLWAAWTQREQFAKWISPFPGVDAEVPEFNATEGGAIRFIMIDENGNRFPEEHGVFETLEKPNRIVMFQANENRNDIFDGFPMRMDVRFEAQGNKTLMRFMQTGYPPNFPMEEAQKGFEACFAQLERVIMAEASA